MLKHPKGNIFRNILWHRGHQSQGLAARTGRNYGSLKHAVPSGLRAAICTGKIHDDTADRNIALHHSRKRRPHAGAIAPNIGVIIKRVGQSHHWTKRRAQSRLLFAIKLWKDNITGQASVGHQACLAARTGHRRHFIAAQRTGEMQQL